MNFQIVQGQPTSSSVPQNTIETWRQDFEGKIPRITIADVLEKTADAWKNFQSYADEEARLEKHLADFPSYITQQDHVIRITIGALQLLLNGNTDQETVDFAKTVAKTGAAFLRRFTNPEKLPKYKKYMATQQFSYHVLSQLNPRSFLLENAPYRTDEMEPKHAIYIHVLRQLRKQIKLSVHREKMRATLRACPAFQNVLGEEFERAFAYLGLTFLYGTKAREIKTACEHASQELVSPGELRRQKILPLTPVIDGAGAIREIYQNYLTGKGLGAAEIAIKDALKSCLDVEKERQKYANFMKIPFSTYDECLKAYDFTAALHAVGRLQAIVPMDVDLENLQIKLKEMHSVVDPLFADESKKEFIWDKAEEFYKFANHVHDLEEFLQAQPPLSITQEDLDLAKIPLVFGSTTTFGVPSPANCLAEPSEEIVPSHLKIGTGITVIFTEPQFIQTVQKLLQKYGLGTALAIESMEVLKTACAMEHTLAPYTYDYYNQKKWEQQTPH